MNNKLKKSISILGLALVLTTPIFATEPVTQAKSQQTAKETTFTTTNLKNPTIINGIAYGDEAFIKKAFGIKFVNKHHMWNKMQLAREDKFILLSVDEVLSNDPKVNDTVSEDASVVAKTINGKVMYPLKFIASQMNSEVKYDTKTKLLTVNNYGLEEVERVSEEFNTLKGRVIAADGKPAVNIQVHLFAPGKIVYTPELESVEGERCVGDNGQVGHEVPIAYTDSDGYYEFKNINTKILPFVNISIQHTSYQGRNMSGRSLGQDIDTSSLLKVKTDKEFNLHEHMFPGLYSDRVELPIIYLR